jgi:hypothetical protein
MRSLPFRADFSGIARSTPLRIQHMSKNPRHERSPKLKRRRVLREPPLCSTALRSGARWGGVEFDGQSAGGQPGGAGVWHPNRPQSGNRWRQDLRRRAERRLTGQP